MLPDSGNDGFTQLFSESRAALRRYVLRLVKSRSATEEIVQEAFLRTYEQGTSVHVPRAFLFSVARNLAFKARRHDRAVKTFSIDDSDAERIYTAQDSPEQTILSEERIRLLQEAIQRLPPQCRAAFALKVFHDCSYQEIAERLGIAKKTVEKHISLALRTTNADLRRHCFPPNTGSV